MPNVNVRLGEATTEFNKLHGLWRHTQISRKTRLRISTLIFYPMVLYALQHMSLTQSCLKRTDAWQARMLRRVLHIPPAYYPRVPNEDVLWKARQFELTDHLSKHTARYLGRCLRASSTLHTVLYDHVRVPKALAVSKRAGRPRKPWTTHAFEQLDHCQTRFRNLTNDLTITNHFIDTHVQAYNPRQQKQAVALANKRSIWRQISDAPTCRPGRH